MTARPESIGVLIAAALAATPTEPPVPVTGLPLSPLRQSAPVAPSVFATVTPIDGRGRLADASPVRALGWQPGQSIRIIVTCDIVIVTGAGSGAETVTGQGHLRLPARIRRLCRIRSGDRLFVVAIPAADLTAIYTMPHLEAILWQHHTGRPPEPAP